MTGRSSDLQRIRIELERAALLAGRQVRRLFRSGKFEIREKEDHTLVTEADALSERTIRRELGKSYPVVAAISEEDEDRRDLHSLDQFFLIDPIDGTWNFAAGIPVFCISVAYLARAAPRAGVLYNPVSGELLSASEGTGSFHRPAEAPPGRSRAPQDPIRLRTAAYRPLAECQVHRHDRRLDPSLARRILEKVVLHARGVRDLGSTTAELGLIASGKSDALVGYHVANWDVAAAALVLAEAGGVVTRLDGHPIDYADSDKFSICAAGTRRLHQEILLAISSIP